MLGDFADRPVGVGQEVLGFGERPAGKDVVREPEDAFELEPFGVLRRRDRDKNLLAGGEAAQIFSRCFRSAMATASEREAAPRRAKQLLRWALTQSGPMPINGAISRLLRPFAT